MSDDLLTLRYVPLSQIERWGRNKKRHDLGALIQSIERHGFRDPLAFDSQLNGGKGGIVEGNGRDLALIEMVKAHKPAPRGIGIVGENGNREWAVPVLFGVDAPSQAAAEAYGIDHNNITMLGGDFDLSDLMRLWDDDFTGVLQDLAKADELPVSVETDDLDRLIAMEQESQDAEPQIDRAEELNKKWQVKMGDLWRIGEHRLLCGDSTKREDVERVMQGEKAGAVVTDSPYGIDRDGIVNDDPKGLRELFDGVLVNMPIENAIVINFQSPRLFPAWLDAVRAVGHKFERMLWMYKPNDETFPWRGWLQTSEAILVSSKGNGEWLRVDPFAHDCYSPTTLGSELPKSWGKAHASIKPIAVVQDLVSRIGGDVYEPFCGSGSTIVACQNLGRKCRAVEISPAYCAVTLERMATAFPDLVIERIE